MKFQIILACILSLFAAFISAVNLPRTGSLHEDCSQNMVCSDGLYCRKEKADEYGYCEDPATLVPAVDVPTPRSLHEDCSQNMVCSDGLYCRKEKTNEYGFCEDPAFV